MNTKLIVEKSQNEKQKKVYPFSILFTTLLFAWPIVWIILYFAGFSGISFIPFHFESTDLLSLLLYSTFLGLLCKPLPLKALLSLTNASFFVIYLILILPFVQSTPLQLFIKIIFPLYQITIF